MHTPAHVKVLFVSTVQTTEPDVNSSFSWKQKRDGSQKATVSNSYLVLGYQRWARAEPPLEECAMCSYSSEKAWDYLLRINACLQPALTPLISIHWTRHTECKDEMQRLKDKMMCGRQQKGAVFNAEEHFSHLTCNAKHANTYRSAAAAAPFSLPLSTPVCAVSPFVSLLLLK